MLYCTCIYLDMYIKLGIHILTPPPVPQYTFTKWGEKLATPILYPDWTHFHPFLNQTCVVTKYLHIFIELLIIGLGVPAAQLRGWSQVLLHNSSYAPLPLVSCIIGVHWTVAYNKIYDNNLCQSKSSHNSLRLDGDKHHKRYITVSEIDIILNTRTLAAVLFDCSAIKPLK